MRTIADILRSHAVFDGNGRHVNGTDKESNHRYGAAYESLFRVWDHDLNSYQGFCSECEGYQLHKKHCGQAVWKSTRESLQLMMEVGVTDGSCLHAWREVFPNAVCVGLDIHPSARAEGNRIEFHLGDQRSREDCERAAAGRKFDLIIEDATHKLEDTLLTLYWLWPHVAPGGLYVVEEWDNIDRHRICELWPNAEIVNTTGPFGGIEPLVIFRKPPL